MITYLIFTPLIVIGFIIGLLIGRRMGKDKPIGCLILNVSDPSKEFFEFHFEDDIDIYKDKKRISFTLVKK